MGLEADERVYGEGVWNNNFVDNFGDQQTVCKQELHRCFG